jgi:hypothetical protein
MLRRAILTALSGGIGVQNLDADWSALVRADRAACGIDQACLVFEE